MKLTQRFRAGDGAIVSAVLSIQDVCFSLCRAALRLGALWIAIFFSFSVLAQGAPRVVDSPPMPAIAAPLPPASPLLTAAQARWHAALAAFASADREHMPGSGGVLFVGSSTIRLWTTLAQDFPQFPGIINRGFGGSTLADCSLFTHDLVARYRPRQVLVYAGENDLAEGQSPMQVLESFARFEKSVRAELPHARINFISIKPSPSRTVLIDKVHTTNRLIAGYVQTLHNSTYIDIHTPMLDAEGRPRTALFRPDQLHLNDSGYRLWQSVIVSHLTAPTAGGVTPTPAAADVRLSVTRATP